MSDAVAQGRKNYSLWQANPAQQIGVAGVRVHPVPERVHCQIGQGSGMLLITLFQQTERLILVAEARINYASPIKIDITVRGQFPEFLGDLQCICPPAREGMNLSFIIGLRESVARA